MTVVALGVLLRVALNVVGRGVLPGRFGVEVRQQILAVAGEDVLVDRHVTQQYVVPGALLALERVEPDLEVQLRRLQLAIRQPLFVGPHVAAVAVLVVPHRVAHLAGDLVLVEGMLHDTVRPTGHGRVTIQAGRHLLAIVTMGVFLPVAVEIGHRMALDAGHAALHPVHIAFHAFVLALILGTDPPPVAGQAGVADGSHLLEGMAGEQAALGVRGPADVTLATRGVTFRAVIVIGLGHLGVAEISAPRLEDRLIALQTEVQAAGRGFDHVGVASATHRFGPGARVAHQPHVGLLLGGYLAHAAVTHDAVGLEVIRPGRELLVADKHLFPCLQRRQLAASALTRGSFGLDLLFLGQRLQRLLTGVAADAVIRTQGGHVHVGFGLRLRRIGG